MAESDVQDSTPPTDASDAAAGLLGVGRRMWAWPESVLLRLEGYAGLAGAAVVVGCTLLGLAAVYVTPTPFPVSHGKYFVALAEDPFPAANPAGHRLLTPLIAYALHMRGNGLLLLNAGFAAAVLGVAYAYGRRCNWRPGLALGVAAVLAFSMPTLSTLFNAGYTDSTTYLLLLLMYWLVRVPLAYWTLYFLALWNSEAVLFLLPFLLLFPHAYGEHAARPRVPVTLACAGVCLAAYAGLRVVHGQYVQNLFTVAYYLDPPDGSPFFWLKQSLPHYYLGFFSVFKLLWVLVFWACIMRWRTAGARQALLVILPVLCAMAQSLVAYDTSRMLCLGFPAMLVSLEVLRERLGEAALTDLVALAVAVNLFVPQYYNTNGHLPQMRSLPAVLLYGQ